MGELSIVYLYRVVSCSAHLLSIMPRLDVSGQLIIHASDADRKLPSKARNVS